MSGCFLEVRVQGVTTAEVLIEDILLAFTILYI